MITLYFKQGTSDKVYQAEIVESGDGYKVNFAYGRRGSTLNTGTKTQDPVSAMEATKIYNKLINSKKAEGYTEGENGATYTDTTNEDRVSGILPMLLNRIPDNLLEGYFTDPNWIEEQKHNGRRVLIRGIDGVIQGINRKGLLIGIPEIIVKELSPYPGNWILDGEMIGEHYKVFDRIVAGYDLQTRKASLAYMMGQRDHPHVDITQYYIGETAKRDFFEHAKRENMEGVVFKHLHGFYVSGRPNSGGDAMKYKFLADITCLVAHENIGKRSVMVSVYDDQELLKFIGNVSIPVNYEIPRFGDIIEVQYLYATSGGILYQPVYKGIRTDHEVDHYASLKFQAEETEE